MHNPEKILHSKISISKSKMPSCVSVKHDRIFPENLINIYISEQSKQNAKRLHSEITEWLKNISLDKNTYVADFRLNLLLLKDQLENFHFPHDPTETFIPPNSIKLSDFLKKFRSFIDRIFPDKYYDIMGNARPGMYIPEFLEEMEKKGGQDTRYLFEYLRIEIMNFTDNFIKPYSEFPIEE